MVVRKSPKIWSIHLQRDGEVNDQMAFPLPWNLRHVQLEDCGDQFIESLVNKIMMRGAECLLEHLEIKCCNNLQQLAIARGGFVVPPTLNHLKISDCTNLVSLSVSDEVMTQQVQEQDDSSRSVDIVECEVTECTYIKSSSDCRSSLTCLTSLDLANCSLQTVEIMWCTKLSHLPSELGTIVSLKTLTIRFCTNLISLPSIQGLTGLQELSITDCYKLVDLPIGLQSCQSLKKLVITWCPDLKVPALNFQECTSLESLWINRCGNLRELPEGLQYLTRLKSLGVGGFLMPERLDCFPSKGLQNLVSVRELRLYGWASVKSLPTELQHLTALQSLTINRFKRIEVLPEWLDSLSSLESLSFVGCEDLKFFPPIETMSGLSKLTSLRIIKCPQLKERCIAETGREWPKISHIPFIVTD